MGGERFMWFTDDLWILVVTVLSVEVYISVVPINKNAFQRTTSSSTEILRSLLRHGDWY